MKLSIMFPPLVIGFICLFASAIGPGGMVHQFTTNNQGVPSLDQTNDLNMTSALIIYSNGLVAPGYFGGGIAVNNQTGQTGYHVYHIVTSLQQMWSYSIPNSSKQIIMTLDNSGTGKIIVSGTSTDMVYMTTVVKNILNNTYRQTVNLGAPYGSGSAYQNWVWQVVIVNTNLSNPLYVSVMQGYGYTVYLQAVLISTSAGAYGNILGSNGMMIILIAALAISGVAAITVFGTGISFFGQKVIFASASFVVLWALLTIGMYSMVMAIPIVGIFVWLTLTAMYLIGVAQLLLSGDVSS